MDVSLKSPDTFSMSANKTGLCDVYSSRLPASHTQIFYESYIVPIDSIVAIVPC